MRLIQVALVIGMLSCFYSPTFAQVQIGNDIDGESGNDRSGYSVAMSDKNNVAIGAILNDGGGSNSGHVRVFTWDGSTWNQKGTDINGESSNDNSGISVVMPDNDFVGIGAYRNDDNGTNSGHVRIYHWDGSAWVQKGNDIDGEAIGDESGRSISMPDTNTVAIGAVNNSDAGASAGHVRVYRWNGTAWVQKGADINGLAADYELGTAVTMADSNTLAVSAVGDIFEPGEVYIYDWNGSAWVQRGSTIVGEATFDLSGLSLSMPSPNYVAIGAANNDGVGNQAGHVRIFNWNGAAWVQVGSDIDGEAAEDRCGASVSMPDSVTIAVGSNWNDGNGSLAGHVRVFRWDGSNWVQDGIDIDGEAASDEFGYSVHMPDDKTVAAGGYFNGGNGFGAGHTRIYSFCQNNTTDVVSACGSYTWIDNNTYTSSNNTATHVLTNIDGCDSTVTLNLTINSPTTATDVISSCAPITWLDGNTYNSSNNTATHTIPNAAGCDSVITLDLTINTSTTATDVIIACDSYTWLDGNTYNSSNNTATHTIPNAAGCDSVITLDLTINTSTASTDVVTACDSYTWLDGNTYTSSNNTATHTIPNGAGCDSVITLDLTINSSTSSTDVITSCAPITWLDGNMYSSSNNTATHIIPNAAGCDSVITLDLTINSSTSSTDVISSCAPITWLDGNMYSSSNNTATHIIPNAAGCDSVITLDLTINTATASTDVITSCAPITWLDGNMYSSSNNTATHIIPNSAGCDSVITLDLTINTATASTDVITSCSPITWLDGNMYSSSNNTATHIVPNAAGCDSVITLDLTINSSTSSTDVISSCAPITWLDGNMYSSSNNTATHIIPNAAGCDSVITLDLTINTATASTDVITSCAPITWLDGNMYSSSNNTATHIIPNAAGCDSIITLDLTINNSTTGTDVITACDSYMWLDGNTYTSSNNTATHTTPNAAGCDSVITLDLTINNSTTGTDVITACDSYMWLDGNTYTSSNNTATHTIPNAAGCDSVITLDLTINNSTTGTDVITACDSYMWLDGNTYTSSNNTATHTIPNAAGCDSVITLDLTINNSTTGTDVITACDSYMWIDGNTYTSSNNTATHIVPNAAGCDSIVTLDLTINSVSDITTYVNGSVIMANNSNATYQWLDCDANYSPIQGETGNVLLTTTNGSYAVELTENGCIDTSACVEIGVIGIYESNEMQDLKLFPNPTNGEFSIDLGSMRETVEISITDISGRLISTTSFGDAQIVNLTLDEPAGVYFVSVIVRDKIKVLRLIKK